MNEAGSERLLPTRPPSPVPSGSPLYQAVRSSEFILSDGSRVLLRPIGPADRDLIADGFERLSPQSRYRRFFAPLRTLSGHVLDYLTSIDSIDHFAWGALGRRNDGGWLGVGVSRYVRLPEDPEAADAAVTVVDDWQGRGLGRILLDALVQEALANGITRFEGEVLVENRPMQELLRRTGARFRPEGGGVLRFSIDLPARDEALRNTPFGDLLRALAKGEVSLYQDEPCPWVSGPARRGTLPRG